MYSKAILFTILLFGNIYIRNTCKRESLFGYKEKESVLIVFFIMYYIIIKYCCLIITWSESFRFWKVFLKLCETFNFCKKVHPTIGNTFNPYENHS